MKNEYKINKKEMMSWAKEYHLQGAANIILFILWSIVGVCGLALLVLLTLSGGKWIRWFLAIWLLVLAVFKLFFSRFLVLSNRYKLFAKTYGVSEWIRTTEFADDVIILTDHTSVTKLLYENIKKIKEKNNVVMIFFNNNLAVRLYTDAFVEGSWEACKAKIDSMMKS